MRSFNRKTQKLINKNNLNRPIKIQKVINEKFDTFSASSLYGFTKLASEKLIQEIFFKKDLKYIINRFGVIVVLGSSESKIKVLYHYG